MITLEWMKCGNGANWCPLETVTLANVDTFGVYLIWHEGNPGRVVRIGQGDIADRLGCHKTDREVLAYAARGTLRVTWASVPARLADGVERYLAESWKPLVGDRFPMAMPVAVNSPF